MYFNTMQFSDIFYFIQVFSDVKYKEGIHWGPIHFFNMMELIKHHCNEDEQETAFASLQENSHIVTPENILLAMAGESNLYFWLFPISLNVDCLYNIFSFNTFLFLQVTKKLRSEN